MTEDHAARVERAFTLQAAAFENPRYNRVFTTDAEWIFDRLELTGDELLLDVAAGTGHAARQLAPSVRAAIALDATKAMLRTGKAHAEHAGLTNVAFVQGDAAALPFEDGSFDVVVSRFAVHHFADPAAPIGEMARVLRPGGRIAVADIVADELPEVAARQNELERLRDPSHTRMLTVAALGELLARTGIDDLSAEVRDLERPLAPWLEQARVSEADATHIADALRAELGGGPASGFAPSLRDGELCFVHRFASLIGTSPPARG